MQYMSQFRHGIYTNSRDQSRKVGGMKQMRREKSITSYVQKLAVERVGGGRSQIGTRHTIYASHIFLLKDSAAIVRLFEAPKLPGLVISHNAY